MMITMIILGVGLLVFEAHLLISFIAVDRWVKIYQRIRSTPYSQEKLINVDECFKPISNIKTLRVLSQQVTTPDYF